MPRVIPGLAVVRWLDEETAGPRRAAVDRWLANLANLDAFLELMRRAGDETSIEVEIPEADLVANCLLVPVLDVIVIESIGSAATE